MTPFAEAVLKGTIANLGVHETGPNSGPGVDQYLAFVGLEPGQPWCAAEFCFRLHQVATEQGLAIDLPKTGSTSALYRWFYDRSLLLARPEPGCVVMVKGGLTGHRHTCLCEQVRPPYVMTVDANESNEIRRAKHLIVECSFARLPG